MTNSPRRSHMWVLQLKSYKSTGQTHPENQTDTSRVNAPKCLKYQSASFPTTGSAIFYLVNTCRYNQQGCYKVLTISLAIKTANNKSWHLRVLWFFCFFLFFVSLKLLQVVKKFYQKPPNFLDRTSGIKFQSTSSGFLECSSQKNQVTTNVLNRAFYC